MPMIKFISHNGSEQEIHVASGISVMQAAVDNGISGIKAECGGACSCGTCHCYVNDAWQAKTGKAGELEKQMLSFVIDPRPNSRLSCQIRIKDELDGLIVHVPEKQY